MTVREPEFSAWDLAVLLADRHDERLPRGRHGLLLAEATNPENKDAFEVDLPTTDFAQLALDRAQERYRKAWPGAEMGSLLWRVEKTS